MKVKQLVISFISWRVFLVVVADIGIILLPFKDSFPYRETVLEKYGSPLLYSWANFDGVHYLGIAENGYWAGFTQAFFPLYPTLMAAISKLGLSPLLSGLLISHISFGVALYYLYLLLRLDYSKKATQRILLYLMLFPTAFYFGAVYTESLFLMLVVTTLYASRKGLQKEAILLATFASATRIIGVLLIPTLIYEQYLRTKHKKLSYKSLAKFVPNVFASTGLLAYMFYLQRNFNDALYFLHAQPAFGAERSADKLILLYQVIYRYFKMLATVDVTSFLFISVSQEFVYSMLFLGLLVVAWVKKVRRSYLLFAAPAYLLPTLTGTFSSMPRYVLILLPCFIAIELLVPAKYHKYVLAVSGLLLAMNTILFTRGYWVA